MQQQRPTPAWRTFARQFQGPLIWLLAGACVLSLVLREAADAIAVAAILVVNAVIGFLQESRAERAVLALRSMTAPRARVLRDARAEVVPAADVVPGDLLLLEAGDVIAADGHLLDAHALLTQEAPLTGESAPVQKQTAPPPPSAPLAERRDSIFAGTSVAAGTGLAEVTATGMRTELGKVAALLASAHEERTPLQRRLQKVGRTLLVLCVALVVVVAAAYLARGMPWLDVLLSATSLAVAAVPEGLAVMVTIALALGVQRMARHHALVRRLPAVETLGSTTVICTDKTGTLTTGIMTVRELWTEDAARLLYAAAAASDAELGPDGRAGVGDPTELALLSAAADRGIRRADIESTNPRVQTQPFDPVRKRMSVLRSDGTLYVKGAPEALLPLCALGTEAAAGAAAAMAERGLRVLAVASGLGPGEHPLRLLGLAGLADPPRPEAVRAVAEARAAGIRTLMITGDHALTARAIAREMGILGPGEDAQGVVYARSTPEEKLQIVRRLKAEGNVVAMTGDGVNDAPALREANIGIAMGITGTEVTREASDMVLADDNFATIVAAVQEGRTIFENIRKALVYLLAGNWGELMVMLIASLAGSPVPLLPLQILWINLVTDGLPALALVMDPPDEKLLARPPRPLAEPLLGAAQWRRIVLVGLLEAAVTLTSYLVGLSAGGAEQGRSAAFLTLVCAEVLRAASARSETTTYWGTQPLTNRSLIGVMVGSIGLQLALYAAPWTRALFHLTAPRGKELALSLSLSAVPVTVLELAKLWRPAPGKRPARGAP